MELFLIFFCIVHILVLCNFTVPLLCFNAVFYIYFFIFFLHYKLLAHTLLKKITNAKVIVTSADAQIRGQDCTLLNSKLCDCFCAGCSMQVALVVMQEIMNIGQNDQ